MCNVRTSISSPLNPYPIGISLPRPLHTGARIITGATMKTTKERFWSKVNKDGPIPAHMPHLGKCWIWKGFKNNRGYGQFMVDGKSLKAHRFAFELEGQILATKECCHHCDNPGCVRPSHLFSASHKENIQDSVIKGRHANGKNRKTHCPRGHEYSGSNLIERNIDGYACRACRICVNESNRKYKLRRSLLALYQPKEKK